VAFAREARKLYTSCGLYEILGFLLEVDEICALLGYYSECVDNSL